MVVAELPYEELRRKKLEENKRKIEELKLSHLSHSLREEIASSATKPSPSKARRRSVPEEGVLVAVRRSERVRTIVNYKEDKVKTYVVKVRRIYRRNLSDRVYASDEAREYAVQRATDLESQLAPEIPSFVKPMLQSHVTGGFWLGLPRTFCTKYLPKKSTYMTLLDEDGRESSSLYLAEKNGLSAGWRGFAINHELVDGDALVFELVTPLKFKVHIIRQSDYYGADGDKSSGKKRKRS